MLSYNNISYCTCSSLQIFMTFIDLFIKLNRSLSTARLHCELSCSNDWFVLNILAKLLFYIGISCLHSKHLPCNFWVQWLFREIMCSLRGLKGGLFKVTMAVLSFVLEKETTPVLPTDDVHKVWWCQFSTLSVCPRAAGAPL